MTHKKQIKKATYKILFISAIIMVVLGIVFSFYLKFSRFSGVSILNIGQVGDFIGGVTSPFINLATLIMVILAYLLQKEETEIAREETRNQEKETQIAQEKARYQEKVLAKQRFENTFFQMVNLQNEIVKAIEYKSVSEIYSGRKFFEFAFKYFKKFYENNMTDINSKWNQLDNDSQNESMLAAIEGAFGEFLKQFQSYIGHYFRNLYYILYIINNETELDEDTKKTYADILQAQLSLYELLLLFYYAISEHGRFGSKKFYDKYKFLHKLDDNVCKVMIIDERHKYIYDNLSSFRNTNME